MSGSSQKFAHILTTAIYRIRTEESKTVKKTLRIVQDELGFALGREGGSAIEYWRKGYIPAKTDTVEQLARELVKRGGLDYQELKKFLSSANYPEPRRLCDQLFPLRSDETFAPFVVGPPITHPRQFFGREQELKRIFSVWQRFPFQNVAVIGLQRSGKTSLLHFLEKITAVSPTQLRPGQRSNWLPQPERTQWVFVDFQNAQLCHQEGLLRYVLSSLKLPVPKPCGLNSFIDVVSQHLQTPAVILMDEIGVGLASPELDQHFWWSLRSLGSNYTNGRLGFLLTAHEVPALLAHEYGKPSPFFNIFGHIVKLGPLSTDAAQELIANSPIPFAPADVEWILEQSGRWPALLQILCHSRLITLEGDQSNDNWRDEALHRLEPYRYLLDQI